MTPFTTQADNFLSRVSRNNQRIDHRTVKKAICVIDFKNFPIGDSVVTFSQLRALGQYLEQATIDLYTTPEHFPLLENNPFLERVYLDYEQVDFGQYELILLFNNKEGQFLESLSAQYEAGADFTTAIYSLAIQFAGYEGDGAVFPFFDDFMAFAGGPYLAQRTVVGQEIFITPAEKAWGETWMRAHGVAETDHVMIVLDNSSMQEKVLRTNVYFELLEYLRGFDPVKILVFDERNVGKERFYGEWMGEHLLDKFVFAEGVSLRQALCLLASDHTKVVFGPCTGLLHCATGIYNAFRHNGTPFGDLPVMITYIGPDPSANKWYWWGESLVDCICLEQDGLGRRYIRKITSTEYACLPCREYTSELLIGFLNEQYGDRLRSFGLTRAAVE